MDGTFCSTNNRTLHFSSKRSNKTRAGERKEKKNKPYFVIGTSNESSLKKKKKKEKLDERTNQVITPASVCVASNESWVRDMEI
jgi:hypothetical protein